jgi:hypothetical protein
VTRLSRFHPQASGLDYTHVNITSHPAIAKPDPTTSNIKHPSILHLGRVPYSGSIRKCIDQLPSAKVRRPRYGRCYMMSRAKLKQTNTRCVTFWAVGFVWHVRGSVTDAKISADYQSEQWLSLNIRKASLYNYMVECLETQVLRQQGSKLVRSVDSMWR